MLSGVSRIGGGILSYLDGRPLYRCRFQEQFVSGRDSTSAFETIAASNNAATDIRQGQAIAMASS